MPFNMMRLVMCLSMAAANTAALIKSTPSISPTHMDQSYYPQSCQQGAGTLSQGNKNQQARFILVNNENFDITYNICDVYKFFIV